MKGKGNKIVFHVFKRVNMIKKVIKDNAILKNKGKIGIYNIARESIFK
jgi:hypothetical protein